LPARLPAHPSHSGLRRKPAGKYAVAPGKMIENTFRNRASAGVSGADEEDFGHFENLDNVLSAQTNRKRIINKSR